MKLAPPFALSTITQFFNGNANPLYAGQGLKGHTAIDWGVPWGTPVPNCAKDAYCYSIMHKDDPDPTKYRAVFTLVEDETGAYEVSYGHASAIFAEVGKTYQVGDVLMNVGNTGDVYAGGVAVTKAARLAGSKAGAHLHGPQVRSCKKVAKTSSKKQYLSDGNGLFKRGGFYYEILDYSNGYNGCVDPLPFFSEQTIIPTPKAPQELKFGLTDPIVSKFQNVLKKTGYFPASQILTEYYGTVTQKAYESFRKETGLKIEVDNAIVTGGEEYNRGMSQTYVAAGVAVIASLLPLFGLEVANNEMVSQNLLNVFTVLAGLWAIYRRVQVGDISWLGIRKK